MANLPDNIELSSSDGSDVPDGATVHLPLIETLPTRLQIRPSSNAPKRAIVLAIIQILIIAHVLHWWITGSSVNVQSFIGVTFVVGVAVANGILMVEFANKGLAGGLSPEQAIRDAARVRLRPILMTALAGSLGVLPMAIGIGHGAEANTPLGRAVLGGLMTATVEESSSKRRATPDDSDSVGVVVSSGTDGRFKDSTGLSVPGGGVDARRIRPDPFGVQFTTFDSGLSPPSLTAVTM